MSRIAPRISLTDLTQLVRQVEPAALLVSSRLLRRIIKRHRQMIGIGLQVPHNRSYVIDAETLLTLTSRKELGLERTHPFESNVILLARLEDQIAVLPQAQALLKYWRMLFHAGVHRALDARWKSEELTDALIRERIHRIGQAEFDEIRQVLRQERFLLPPRDDRTVYEEFAALYLELSYFDAPLLPRYFPSIKDFELIEQILNEDINAAELFKRTRLAGAPEPEFSVLPAASPETDSASGSSATAAPASAQRIEELTRRATNASATGNSVRAAMLLTQAAMQAPPERREALKGQVHQELQCFMSRLRQVLAFDPAEEPKWRRIMVVLLPWAVRGIWPAEARLLFDLQKVCVDHERPVCRSDVTGWVLSLFREPLVKPLPHQALVLAVKHLQTAVDRLPSVRLSESRRQDLSNLLHDALARADRRLRERFRPILLEVVHEAGLCPSNFPEKVARDKLVEELLDLVGEHCHLNMGQVRDAIARNQLKLPDLSGPKELVTGDPLILTNRLLAKQAPGIYHPGEIYLRWMQNFSAVAFGTTIGRWFSLFIALPFGGAFATVIFVQEMLHLAHLPHHLEPLAYAFTVGGLGLYLLLLLHARSVRSATFTALVWIGKGLRWILFDLPAAVIRLPLMRRLMRSRAFLLCFRFILLPAPVGLIAWYLLSLSPIDPTEAIVCGFIVLFSFSLLLNSRHGRNLEEIVTDWAARRWVSLRDLIPGLIRWTLMVFATAVEVLDRFLYTVDEWLRFRTGDGRWTRAFKTVFGLIWFIITYVIRLTVNVFLEPSINPVKHFPAVTVAAKLLVPFWIPLTDFFATPFMFLGSPLAVSIAFTIIHTIPGAAGFLVWEFKENWRLYRANRSRSLKPVMIGSHGETLLRLLKPGIHSGTLPKLFIKLRRAERIAQRYGDWKAARRYRESLHHVEASLRHFVHRELLAFFNQPGVQIKEVDAGSNRVWVHLVYPTLGAEIVEIVLEEQSGWILASIPDAGWLPRLSEEQQHRFRLALAGWYRKAGVDLLREEVAARLGSSCPPYDITDLGLLVWPGHDYHTEVVYDLEDEPRLSPQVMHGSPSNQMPELDANQLLLSRRDMAWSDWVAAWEADAAASNQLKQWLGVDQWK